MEVLVVAGGHYQGTRNIRKLKSTYFSIKNKKFIRPVRRYGDSVSGWYEYRLFPGTYISLSYYFWTKESCISVSLEIIKLVETENNYGTETLKSVEIRCDEKSEIEIIMKDFTKAIEIVKDFISAIPRYHVSPSIKELSNKIYDEESVRELIEFINKFNNQTLYKMESE